MATIIDFDDLDHEAHSHEFVGAEHGDVPFSVILVHSKPGVGPKLHRHPYAEVFIVESGQATFRIGEDSIVVDAGHVGAHDRPVRDHHRLMAVADVVREQRPLGTRRRFDHEDRLVLLHDAHDDPRLVEQEAVVLPQDRPALERRDR